MAENSAIQWCDHTFNPWIGCAKVSAGCKHCYAETLMDTRYGRVEWGVNGTRSRTSDANWKKPLAWNRAAEKAGKPARVFCASLADVFEDRPELEFWRDTLFVLIEQTPWLRWQLLTKRPENVMGMVPESWRDGFPPHVWIGTSVEDQAAADERIPHLLQIPAKVRFLSCEPLIGPVKVLDRLMGGYNPGHCGNCGKGHGFDRCPNYGGIQKTDAEWGCTEFRRVDFAIHWVIIGGESGPRPCDVAWIRSLVRQCKAAGVPAFVKQLGAVPSGWCVGRLGAPEEDYGDDFCDLYEASEIGAPCPHQCHYLRDHKGGDMEEWPADLRVREFPHV